MDIDSEMIRIAKTWFGLNEKLSTCIVDDGIQFLQRKVQENGENLFSSISSSSILIF